MRTEIKWNEEFNHEAWEKETSDVFSFLFFFFFFNKIKGRRVLHKWRKILDKDTSPKKWRGNREIAWKRIQNIDSKDYPKSWKYNGETQKSINKDLEKVKNNHTETNNTITEIKNTLEGINSRIYEAEERIRELEDRWEKKLLKSRIK